MQARVSHVMFRNFRGSRCDGVQLFPLTILAGRNNSGKTTLLEAISLGINGPESLAWVLTHRGFIDPVSDIDRIFGLDCVVQTSRGGADTKYTLLIKSKAVPFAEDVSGAKGSDFAPARWLEFNGDIVCKVAISSTGHTFIIWQRRNQSIESVLAHIDPERCSPSELTSVLSNAQEGGLQALGDVVRFATSWDPEIQDIRAFRREGSWAFEVIYAAGSLPLHFLGDGMRRAVQIASVLARNDIVVLDEPEAFQHESVFPQLVEQTWEAVRSGRQVILTTHSRSLIQLFARRADELPEQEKRNAIGLVEVTRSVDGKISPNVLAGCSSPMLAQRLAALFGE